MKKLTILVILFISMAFSVQTFSQSVPSPSASQMTRYGNASLNESSGRITTGIPIYSYQAGNISVPYRPESG